MFVLGIDGSTAITGVALVEFDRGGPKAVNLATEIDASAVEQMYPKSADALTQRVLRIGYTRERLEELVSPFPLTVVDYHVAYEYHTMVGGDASEALSMAAGAYLSIPQFAGRPVLQIGPSTAKSIWGGAKLRRVDAKLAVVQWARREFRLNLADSQDAIGDALAVCVAAWSRLRAQSHQQAQTTLFGKTAGRK